MRTGMECHLPVPLLVTFIALNDRKASSKKSPPNNHVALAAAMSSVI